MKLHLPKMLTAALLAAASVITTSATAQAETYKGLEFSGDIFTIENTASEQFHLATFSNWYYTGTDWVKSSNTWLGTGNFYYEGETRKSLNGNNNSFWRRMFGDANGGDAALLGNTIRLTGASGTAYYEATFNPFRLGGVIAEAGDATYIVGRKSGECGITLNARTGASANMSIEANTILSVGTAEKNNGNVFTVATGGTWTVATGKTLSVGQHGGSTLGNAKAINFNSGANVTINGGGTVDLTHTNALTINSSLTIGESTTVNFAAISTLSNTINNAGAVTFAGTVTLSESLSGFDVSGTYVDYQGQTAANGYAGALDYTIIKGNAANLTQVVWKGATQDLTNGVMHVAGDVDKTNYHLVTTDYTLDLAAEMEHNAQLSKVTMAAGTTLNYNANNYSGTIEAAATSTVNIAEGVTATATITAGVLQGKGTYALANGVSSLGNVTLGDNWTGAVRISTGSTTVQKMEEVFSGLAREGYSSVEIKGVAGWFNGTGDLAHNLILTGADEGGTGTALQVNNGSSGAVRGFTGTISGKGDFEHTWVTNGAQSYNFSGNIAGWEGAFKDTGDGAGAINVAFTGDAKVINADITHNRNCTTTVTFTNTNDVAMNGSISKGDSNVLNLVVDAPVTFSKAVSASKLTINAGETATLKGAATIGGLDCLGTLVVDAGENTVAISGDSNTLAHAITLTSGTLSLSGTYDVSALPVIGSETIEGGAGIAEGSGFVHYEGNVTVVDMTDSTGTLNIADGTVFSHTVGNLQVNQGTGIATVASTNYSALWVKSVGDVSYTAAQTIAGATPVSTVHLDVEEGVITMDKADAAVALVLSEGISGTVNATAATTIGSVTGLGEGQVLTITGSAPVTFGAAVSGGTVSVDSGTLNLGNAIHNLAELSVTNGTVTAVGVNSGNGCISGTISIGEGGVFKTTGHHDVFGYGDNATDLIVMGGSDPEHIASLQMTPDGDETVTMTTDIEMNGYAAITSKTGFNTFDGTITATGEENSIDKMWLRKDVTIIVAEEGDMLTIGRLQRFSGFDGTIIKEGDGTLVLSGSENVLDQAITVNAGTLQLDGTFAIDDIEHTGDTYSYTGGEVQGNGFLTTIAKRTVVTGDGYVDAENALFTVGGEEAQYENGVVTSTTTDNTSFWVFSGTEKVSTAKRQEDLQNISVFDGKLLVDEDYDSASISAVIDIIDVEIAGNATLNGTGENMKLSGAGTYALDNATTALGTGVTLDEQDWTGTVALSGISGAAGNNLNLNSYGHEGSKVAMDGVSGYFLQAQAVFAPELVLEGAGLTLNNGFSTMPSGDPKPPTTYTFAGGVSGEGDMTFNRPAVSGASTVTQHLYFTGDVMNWTGSLNVVSLFNVYAQYSGADQKVNSTISRTGGELHVEVGTGSDASVVTFSKAITADDLTVKAGATAYINGGLTTSTITVDEGATLAINGNTTLTSAITSAGTVTLTNVALSDAFTETPGGEAKYYIGETQNYYMGSADKYLTVVTGDGAANATGTGLTWTTLTGLEMANGQVITGAGEANYGTLFVGGDTTSADIVGYGHKDALTSIVVESGTLTLTEGELPQTVAITVSEHGTIAGDVEPTVVEIAKNAKAEFTKPVTGNHYTFSAAEGGTVAVTNSGEAAAYTGGNRDMTVVADTLEAPDAWDEVTISNIVQVKNVVAGDAAILTLDNVDGTLDLQNLEIGSMAFVQVYASDNHVSDNEATVVISDTLTAGLGSTLNADLTMKGGSTLDLDGSNGIAALTLGSTLTLDTADGLVNLGEDIISYLSNMQVGESVDLFTRGYGTSLDYGDEYEGAYYDALFVRTDALVGDFTVYADGDHFGLTKCNNVPEPTTGTLSLLALAALAARRRKHN